jgi:hypothetical protein
MAIWKRLLATLPVLVCLGCFDAPLELVPGDQGVRVKALEGRFVFMPDFQGDGMVAVGGGQLDMAWDDRTRTYGFESVPRKPGLPKGMRMSDTVFKSLRLLPLDPARPVYLAQMTDPHYEERQAFWRALAADPAAREKARKDHNLSEDDLAKAIPEELARKPSNFFWLVTVDAKGTVLGGDDPDNAWVMGLRGFKEALAAGDAERARRLLKDHVRDLPPDFFKDRILVPAGRPGS